MVATWEMTGTFKHDYNEIKGTGKKFNVRGVDLFKINKGKIQENALYFDMFDCCIKWMPRGGDRNSRPFSETRDFCIRLRAKARKEKEEKEDKKKRSAWKNTVDIVWLEKMIALLVIFNG